MTDLLRLTLIIILLTITFASYFLVIGALFTNRVNKTKNVIDQTPGRSFGLGMVNFLFFGAIAFALLSVAENTGAFIKGLLTIPALIILTFLTILLSIGLTGMVKILSERIFPDLTSWKQIAWGSVVLCFACALPFIGWFLLLPCVAFIGIGGTILGIVQKS
jgi:hypothetical protein